MSGRSIFASRNVVAAVRSSAVRSAVRIRRRMPSASDSASTPSAHATAAHTLITLSICDSAIGADDTPTPGLEADVETDPLVDDPRQCRAQLLAGLSSFPRTSTGVEVPRTRDRGHPDLPCRAMAVDDDLRAVLEIEP